MRIWSSLFLATLVIGSITLAPPSLAEETAGFPPCRLAPLDESSLDPSFKVFWKALRDAVTARDVAFLTAHLDPDLKWNFGMENGREQFLETMTLQSDPSGSRAWTILSQIMALGGTFDDASRKQFTAPYVFSRWPDTYDPFGYLAVTGVDVRLRERPRSAAAVLTTLSHELVKALPNQKSSPPDETIGGETFPWVQVLTSRGQAGYVWGKYTRSPIDWRMTVERREKDWIITVLIAGD